MELPPINQRIKLLVERYASNSGKKFSELIELSNSQRFNRIFILDKRNNQYPIPSTETIMAIVNKFSEISIEWLFTGKGEMLKVEDREELKGEIPASIQKLNEDLLSEKEENKKLNREIGALHNELQHYKSRLTELEANSNKLNDSPEQQFPLLTAVEQKAKYKKKS